MALTAAESAPSHLSPLDLFEKYNGHAKAVILRINESRDTGEQSQHALYNKMKMYLAAPPPTITVNEKYIVHYEILNVCGIVITTNYKETGLFLPPDDRRHFALWSERQPEDFKPEEFQPKEFTPQRANPTYWDWMWSWYENGGYEHAAAPPSPAMNSRRRRQMRICPSLARNLSRQNSPSLWGLPYRLLHCGISALSADGFMAEMGHRVACSGRAYHVGSWSRKRTLPGLAAAPGAGQTGRGRPMSAYRIR
jgi:hypothetical protein